MSIIIRHLIVMLALRSVANRVNKLQETFDFYYGYSSINIKQIGFSLKAVSPNTLT